ELLTQGTKERIYKLKDQGPHVKTYIKINALKENRISKRVKAMFQHSKMDVSPSLLNSDVVGIISNMVWDGQIKRLNAILHDLNSLKDDKKEIRLNEVNILIHRLQRNIFQTVDYMYKQELISAKDLKEFFQLDNTLEVAALNLYFTPARNRNADFWDVYHRNKNPISILNRWDCANYRTLYEAEILRHSILFKTVLDEREKRYFSYLSLKTFNIDFDTFDRMLYDFFFEDDHLFRTLEECFSNASKNSSSQAKNTLNHGEIHQYSQIRDRVQAIIQRFNTSEDEQMATAAFFVLDFLQSNYGLEILDIQKGELIQEKMSSTSSKFELFAEFQNIKWFIENKSSSHLNLKGKINLMGEVKMIYKYYRLLYSKFQHTLSQDKLVYALYNHKLHREIPLICHSSSTYVLAKSLCTGVLGSDVLTYQQQKSSGAEAEDNPRVGETPGKSQRGLQDPNSLYIMQPTQLNRGDVAGWSTQGDVRR
ncbi:hypothetical protein VP01_2690g2, partial [Puccinia sorghi]